MTWTLPNTLTTLRLIAAPGVAVMFLYFARPWADWYALILFVTAATTDFFDGYLARKWKQESNLGRMMDPIADKAMVVIALLVITGFSGMNPWILLPATLILFREVFVSGLREFLGENASSLQVTRLAKWKTTAQMVAIAVLFAEGIFEHHYVMRSYGMSPDIVNQVFDGQTEDIFNLQLLWKGIQASWYGGVTLLWVAGVLTLISGFDYFFKALPYLKDPE
ncbi:MAG: CDP-diacylglycerol--glycerol-3-phosphate 3-phosphatidyltransferase [Rhodobacteraceae bacterium]|nr:CDP-diacylglycerol--glycerol-3-phosphate 3-phosphatidyltransferase [Paracoccaceae bacterium]